MIDYRILANMYCKLLTSEQLSHVFRMIGYVKNNYKNVLNKKDVTFGMFAYNMYKDSVFKNVEFDNFFTLKDDKHGFNVLMVYFSRYVLGWINR